MKLKMLLGIHVSSAGKIYEAVNRAQSLGCNTMQIFTSPPQQWRRRDLSAEDIREFARRKKQAKIKSWFIHLSYLINLASPEPALYRQSVEAFLMNIMEAESLTADYIVTHMGSHKMTSEPAGVNRFSDALFKILHNTTGTKAGILLENTAGQGSSLGYDFRHQREILENLHDNKRIGLCLDTAHAYAAGYDIANKNGLEKLLKAIKEEIGLDKLKLVHLNDCACKLGARHDRHAHIGRGAIGMAGMRRIINHPALRNLPFILETPKDSPIADKINLDMVRKLREE